MLSEIKDLIGLHIDERSQSDLKLSDDIDKLDMTIAIVFFKYIKVIFL